MILSAYLRLVRAGFVLAREGALSIISTKALPPALAPLRFGIWLGRLIERPSVRRTGHVERLNKALNRLGPTYVKFGQTLATRPDVVGPEIANDLAGLQDKMEPFDPALVPAILSEALEAKAAELTEMSPPIAAASIAQVHRARLRPANGLPRTVAVKILRPGVQHRFMADIESFYAAARLADRLVRSTKRLRPVEVVETLDRSARLELDLRLEAAAISEMAENIKDDTGFVIPTVSWDHVAQNVLTTTWVDGIPIRDHAALEAAGIDRKALASKLLQSFLRHAIRDGFFHADMHPGNLFADPRTGDVIAVDFGMAGGTGDVAERIVDASVGYAEVVVSDINADMLRVGAERAKAWRYPAQASFVEANAEELPFADNSFDAYTIAFGIRNVPRIQKALNEAHRVLKRGGRILVLEFSQVDVPGFDAIYKAFSDRLIPPMGKLVTGDAQPYQYLVESIRKFPNPALFQSMLAEAGFKRVRHTPYTGNIAALFSGWKI